MLATNDKERRALLWGIGITLGFLLFIALSKYFSSPAPPQTTFANTVKKKELLTQVRIDLLEAGALANNAVMALTADHARDFAQQSRTAAARVDQDLRQLQELAQSTPIQNERALLAEVNECWTNLRTLDQVICDLAAQSTNNRARMVSRGRGAAALHSLEQALADRAWDQRSTLDRERTAELRSRAMIAALKIYSLHSPHIDEASEEVMTRMEAQMHGEEQTAIAALAELSELVADQAGLHQVEQAKAALAQFTTVTREVLDLSRQNSNVKSLELSLGRKRSVTALCNQSLDALKQTVDQSTFKATR